jgi:AhpD family alkylhydroperoxidase
MTPMSRFQIHDDLTAPEDSLAILRGALAGAASCRTSSASSPGRPAALRAYARFRSELRNGSLHPHTLERIALAVAEHQGADAGVVLHQRTARQAGLGLDEVALARRWDSRDPREAVLLRYLRALLVDGAVPSHLHEEARETGWSDEALLEAIAVAALELFTGLVHVAGDVPADGSVEESRQLRAA